MSLAIQFLTKIRGFALEADGASLKDWLQVENDVPDIYYNLAHEIRSNYPDNGSDALEKFVDNCLPEEDNVPEGKGSPWPGFNSFIKDYLEYWRDVNFDDVVNVYTRLSELLISCANALANPTYGVMLLPTSMALSESLSKLVMSLTRQPEVLALIEGDETGDGESKSVVEMAADIIQKFFTSCLGDRSSTRWAPPKGKKVAVYLFANLTLKLLFACEKSHLAVQMFTNLSTSGPALALYPASQRVTFLYYLGRFNFDNAHYFRAHMCLEEAYRQCHTSFLKHRRQILTWWIPSNMLCGRFPSVNLLSRPDAAGFGEVFLPICRAVRSGNFVAFRAALEGKREWLWERGLYLVFLYRLKPLLWRSLTRKTFLLRSGMMDDAVGGKGGEGNKAASLAFEDVVTTATYVQRLLEGYTRAGFGELVPPPGGPKYLMPSEGLIFGNKKPDVDSVESVVAGLVYGGLLQGFIARQQGKFAVEGAKRYGGNAVRAGWPGVYEALGQRFRESWEEGLEAADRGEGEVVGEFGECPGWVRDSS
ncbi:hypothetical protein QC762_601600 [Podospora pseudocomata]|uniref:COP9 signalosome complex subunit 12 n=2 Tax=Podospora TaxID=5144 RepID=A0A090CPY7_PODAN|nr:hypothetical protein QC762_601600 [Podospora pseudocomata]CDP30876.1 Putative COP9 signalosome complex subunit 12 [Podospora anserina S mat+]